jgi:hypothetical protein
MLIHARTLVAIPKEIRMAREFRGLVIIYPKFRRGTRCQQGEFRPRISFWAL